MVRLSAGNNIVDWKKKYKKQHAAVGDKTNAIETSKKEQKSSFLKDKEKKQRESAMTQWLGWCGCCLKFWFVYFWRKWFLCLTDLFWWSPGRLGAALQIFVLRKERSIFSLSALQCACASTTTSRTQDAHLHMFVLARLCSLWQWKKNKIKGCDDFPRFGANIHALKCGLNRFPELLTIHCSLDHFPTFLALARASEPGAALLKPLTDAVMASAVHSPQDGRRSRIFPFTLNMQIQFVIPSALTLGERNKERTK